MFGIRKIGVSLIIVAFLITTSCLTNSSKEETIEDLSLDEIVKIQEQQDKIEKEKNIDDYKKRLNVYIEDYQKFKKDAGVFLEFIKQSKLPVYFYYLSNTFPNSASGVDLKIKLYNSSDKAIKYITIGAKPLNAVDDYVKCTIRDYILGKGKITGPIEPMGIYQGSFSDMWYNSTIKKLELNLLKVVFLDGDEILIDDLEILKKLFIPVLPPTEPEGRSHYYVLSKEEQEKAKKEIDFYSRLNQ